MVAAVGGGVPKSALTPKKIEDYCCGLELMLFDFRLVRRARVAKIEVQGSIRHHNSGLMCVCCMAALPRTRMHYFGKVVALAF